MNMIFERWAVKLQEDCYSEVLQLIAFAQGYSWQFLGNKVCTVAKNGYLVFTSDGNISYQLESNSILLVSFQKAIENLLMVKVIRPKCKMVGNHAIYSNGEVCIWKEDYWFYENQFDELVKERDEFLGRNKTKDVSENIGIGNYAGSFDEKPKEVFHRVSFTYTNKKGITRKREVLIRLEVFNLIYGNSFDNTPFPPVLPFDTFFGYDTEDGYKHKTFFTSSVKDNHFRWLSNEFLPETPSANEQC